MNAVNALKRAPEHRGYGAPVLVAIGCGLLLRIALLAALASSPLVDDARDYQQTAIALLRGVPFELDWPPGVPYLLVPFLRLFGAHDIVGRGVMVAVYLAFAFVFVALLRRAVSPAAFAEHRKATVVSLGVFVVAPSFLLVSVTPLTMLPTALLMCAALATAIALAETPSLVRGVLFGALLGALVLVRPSNVALAGAALVWLAWAARKRLPTALVAALVTVTIIGAWTLKAHDLSGRWVFVNGSNSQNFYYGNNPWTPVYKTWWFGSHKQGEAGVPDAYVEDHRRIAEAPPAERDKAFSRAAMDHIKRRPDLFVVRSLSRMRTFLAFDTFAGAQVARKAHRPLLGLAVIGFDGALYVLVLGLAVIRLFTEPIGRNEKLVLGAAFLYTAPYVISFSHPTYHLPIVPLAGVLAAQLVARFFEARAAGRPWSPTVWTPLRKRALIATLLVLLAIQIEWALVSRSQMS